jgi:hypothetical protein
VDVRFEKLEDGVSADLADKITTAGTSTPRPPRQPHRSMLRPAPRARPAPCRISRAKALAVGIRGGQDDDVIDNLGFDRDHQRPRDGVHGRVTVAVSSKGRRWRPTRCGRPARKRSRTPSVVDGDGGILKSKTITFQADLDGAQLAIEKKETGASGNDIITNEQTSRAFATSLRPSLGVAFEAEEGRCRDRVDRRDDERPRLAFAAAAATTSSPTPVCCSSRTFALSAAAERRHRQGGWGRRGRRDLGRRNEGRS